MFRTAICSLSTVRHATLLTNTSFPRTSTTAVSSKKSSRSSTAVHSKATPTSQACSPKASTFYSPDEVNGEYRLGNEKVMINVGSVGQPRDGDPRSCYAILDEDVVRFRRVSYPLDKTIQKIYAVPELDNFLGDRLRDGR